jgi:hypothetical protein
MAQDDTEGIRLSLKQHGRWMSLKDFLEGRRTAKEAAQATGVSVRHVRRLAKRAREVGVRCLVHGNQGRPSNRRTRAKLLRKIHGLYRARYEGFNLTHFREMLVKREKLKPVPCCETIRGSLLAAGLWERQRKAAKHRQRRPRMEREGEMLQVDASLHHWFGDDGPYIALVGAIDDATGKVPAAMFVPTETTEAYMGLFRIIFDKRGVPLSVYSDRHGVFHINSPKAREAAMQRGTSLWTQFGRAMRELGVKTIYAWSPQAKGRVERLWQTFQDRLRNELRLNGIKSIEEANRFLQRDFLPRFNKQFAVVAANPRPAWRPSPGPARLASVMCTKATRILSNDHTFAYEGNAWQVRPTLGVPALARRQVEVRVTLKGQVQAWLGDRRLRIAPAPISLRLVKSEKPASPLTRLATAAASYTRRAKMHF